MNVSAMTTPDDLTVRLRRGFGGLVPPVCDEAANEIERLKDRAKQNCEHCIIGVADRAEHERLRVMKNQRIADLEGEVERLLVHRDSLRKLLVERDAQIRKLGDWPGRKLME